MSDKTLFFSTPTVLDDGHMRAVDLRLSVFFRFFLDLWVVYKKNKGK